jgi:hypothetical protein
MSDSNYYDHRERERGSIGETATGGIVLTVVLLLFGLGTVLYVYWWG